MKPEDEQKEEGQEETLEDLPAAGNRFLLSLKRFLQAIGHAVLHPKHLLQAGAVKIIDAGSGLLQRLRKRTAESSGDEAPPAEEKSPGREKSRGKDTARESGGKEAQAKEAAPPRQRSSWLSFLIYLLVLVIGIIAGMIFSFALLSTMMFNQAHKIEDQRDAINQLEKQHSQLLESEAKFRKENKEYRQRLSEMETLAAGQNAAKEAPVPEPAGNPAAPVAAKPPAPKKTGNCNLEAGNINNNLSRCLDEFNRK